MTKDPASVFLNQSSLFKLHLQNIYIYIFTVYIYLYTYRKDIPQIKRYSRPPKIK